MVFFIKFKILENHSINVFIYDVGHVTIMANLRVLRQMSDFSNCSYILKDRKGYCVAEI
ncbi:hypothetical protein GCM10028778_03970 [Barrientosiimonas marina]